MNFSQCISKVTSEIPVLRLWNDEFGTSYPEGSRISISCPFHGDGSDKMKSAKAYPDSNKVFCWGCSKSRDTIEIVKLRHELSFREAIDYLLKKYFPSEKLEFQKTDEKKIVEIEVVGRAERKLEFIEQIIEKVKSEVGWKSYYELCYIFDFLKFSLISKNFDQEKLLLQVGLLEAKACFCLKKTNADL